MERCFDNGGCAKVFVGVECGMMFGAGGGFGRPTGFGLGLGLLCLAGACVCGGTAAGS